MPDVTRLQAKNFSSDHDEIAREGARRMLAQALEAEVADYIARNQERGSDGRALVVRNGKARPRKVTLGSGTIGVRAPRIDDRRESEDGTRHRFRSQILPPDMRRSPKVAEVLPSLFASANVFALVRDIVKFCGSADLAIRGQPAALGGERKTSSTNPGSVSVGEAS